MKLNLAVAAISAILLVGVGNAFSEGDAVPSVKDLGKRSEIIVIGTASVDSSDSISAQIGIEVVRVLKGSVAAGSRLRISLPLAAPCGVEQQSQPITAIWFLQHTQDGSVSFTDSPKFQRCHPFENRFEMPAGSLPAVWSYSDTDPIEDKLASEIAWSLEESSAKKPVAAVLDPALISGASRVRGTAVYRQLTSSSIQEAHMAGILGLLEQGDASTLKGLVDALKVNTDMPLPKEFMQNGKTTKIVYRSLASSYEHALAGSISQITNSDSDTIAELAKLLVLSHANMPVQYAAAQALANLHTATAVSVLAPFLYDPDPRLRAYAVGALACFANALPVLDPTARDGGLDLNKDGPFKTSDTMSHFTTGLLTIAKNEDYYLSYWRSWWREHHVAVTTA